MKRCVGCFERMVPETSIYAKEHWADTSRLWCPNNLQHFMLGFPFIYIGFPFNLPPICKFTNLAEMILLNWRLWQHYIHVWKWRYWNDRKEEHKMTSAELFFCIRESGQSSPVCGAESCKAAFVTVCQALWMHHDWLLVSFWVCVCVWTPGEYPWPS